MIIDLNQVPEDRGSGYPESLRSAVQGRIYQRLGKFVGLTHFGVNLVALEPGSSSSLRHWHSHEDEFVYVLEGEPTLITNAGEQVLQAGSVVAFVAGDPDGHHFVNRSQANAKFLVVGNRDPEDVAYYPEHDLIARKTGYTHRDGTPY